MYVLSSESHVVMILLYTGRDIFVEMETISFSAAFIQHGVSTTSSVQSVERQL